jgi:hypothetical protein
MTAHLAAGLAVHVPLDTRWYVLRPGLPAPPAERFGATGPVLAAIARQSLAEMAGPDDPSPELVAVLGLWRARRLVPGVLTVRVTDAAGSGLPPGSTAAELAERLRRALFPRTVPGVVEIGEVEVAGGARAVRARRPETDGRHVLETLRYLYLSPDGRKLAVALFVLGDLELRDQLAAAADSVLREVRWTS